MSKILSKKQVRTRSVFMSLIALASVLAITVFYIIMTQSGFWLVDDDEFNHVDWVVILDGQSADMERSDYVANLVSQGKADSVLILGRRIFRNLSNADFYVKDFMQLGDFDSNAVFVATHDDPSTLQEAITIIPWLKQRKADTVLLVTAAAATHRVKNIFNKLSGEGHPVYLTADIHYINYNAAFWFAERESSKNWIREWAALAASFYDLWNVDPLNVEDSTYFVPIISVKEMEAQKNPIIDLQSLLPKVQKKIEDTVSDTLEIQKEEPANTKADSTKTEPAT